MILTKASNSNRYWLIKSNNYAIMSTYGTIKNCFSALSDTLFDITNQYTILQDTIISSIYLEITDYIIWQHPTDLTYEEFCEQFPEYLV